MMRQADSTIKGYLYQFNKSIEEILLADDVTLITVEGVIEDIDIQTSNSMATIQCKYHEDQTYQVSSVAKPILEMLCHFNNCAALGQCVEYVLYAYFKENTNEVDMNDFISFLESTQNKELILKYFHHIYTIPDLNILNIANKEKKKKTEKELILDYYKAKRQSLKLKVDISSFWSHFTYIQADQFDMLKEKIIGELKKIVDSDTANNLYYPNAFSIISELSSKQTPAERTITRKILLEKLAEEKSVLMTRWALEATNRKQLLKNKRTHLSGLFATNPDIRAFVFTDDFLATNKDEMITMIQQYLAKYYKKPKLQKPPLFIFGKAYEQAAQNAIIGLYKYQQAVNTGIVGGIFMADSFVANTDCASNFKCKITSLCNVDDALLERCHVNQLFWIGNFPIPLKSTQFIRELLDVQDVHTLKYLFGLEKTLEVL